MSIASTCVLIETATRRKVKGFLHNVFLLELTFIGQMELNSSLRTTVLEIGENFILNE